MHPPKAQQSPALEKNEKGTSCEQEEDDEEKKQMNTDISVKVPRPRHVPPIVFIVV